MTINLNFTMVEETQTQRTDPKQQAIEVDIEGLDEALKKANARIKTLEAAFKILEVALKEANDRIEFLEPLLVQAQQAH